MGVLSKRAEEGVAHLETDGRAGQGCVTLENTNRRKLLTTTPPEVYLILERRGLAAEYTALAELLYTARKGTMGVWKCSELARAIYIRGYDETFRASGVPLYLTKTPATGGGSTVKLCFVDRALEPDYVPPSVYREGARLKFPKGAVCKANPKQCEDLGKLAEGVYGQVLDDHADLSSDKFTLPVGLLKLLERKGLLNEHMEMAALINTGDRSGFSAAKVVADFKEAFRGKGVSIFFAQKKFKAPTSRFGMPSSTPPEWHQWLGYAELGVAWERYTPSSGGYSIEYPQRLLDLYGECKEGNATGLAREVAAQAHQLRWGGCGDVAGAVDRRNAEPPKCKCRHPTAMVFCGDRFAAPRKFDRDSVLSLRGCGERAAYCSSKPCVPLGGRP